MRTGGAGRIRLIDIREQFETAPAHARAALVGGHVEVTGMMGPGYGGHRSYAGPEDATTRTLMVEDPFGGVVATRRGPERLATVASETWRAKCQKPSIEPDGRWLRRGRLPKPGTPLTLSPIDQREHVIAQCVTTERKDRFA
jgi:hypothetical protein